MTNEPNDAAVRPVTRHTPFAELPEWLTPEDAWTYLGIGRTTLYALLQDRTIPHQRYGRLIRIPKHALADSQR